jgi:hypothetical protein
VGAAIAGLTGVALSGIGLLPAHANPNTSQLQASPNPINLDFVSPTSLPVTVNLDPSTCQNVFQHGQAYSITAVVQDPSVASVTPAEQGPLMCTADKNMPTSAVFTVAVNPTVCSATSGVTTAATSVQFDPVAGPPGQQQFVSGISVPVNVSSVPACSTGSGGGGGPSGNPAAPAVAAAYLMANETPNNALITACKTNIPYKGNGWFGAVISLVAHDMPTPESIKDNTTIFPDGTWISWVQTGVNAICNGLQWPAEP